MGEFRSSGRDDGELSWTNEALPLEVRRELLDKALEEFRTARAAGIKRASLDPGGKRATSKRAGETTSDRDSPSKDGKPQA